MAQRMTSPTAPSAALIHTSARWQKGAAPTRDGSELSQPLEPANVRAFWDNLRHEDGSDSHTVANEQHDTKLADISKQRELVSTIIHKKDHKGAVMLGLYTQRLCDVYERLDQHARVIFLQMLSREFCAPKGSAQESAKRYLDSVAQSNDPAQSALLARSLRDDLTPQFTELFDQINRLPGGFAFLVHMRADMLAQIRKDRDDMALRAMSDGLMKKLETWIIGTLDLKRITWNSPAYTIERLGQYESVHAVKSWLDVKRRLGNGRRCFGFFHRSVPMEPLVFVWVALTDDISGDVQSILQEREPTSALGESSAKVPGATTWTAALKHIIDSHGWTSDQQILDAMEPIVRALGAHYLVNAKRRKSHSAFDPVANFHLRNGACLHRVNWRGNTSYSGLRQSLGLMCNYNYVLDRIEDNNEHYIRDGTIAVSGNDPFVVTAMRSFSAKL
ncbi:hypothetical protein GGI23_002122 [Coemansia sp. RSA 2559]|nr:hypothetical protein GGI23_002122 [Coemansia sp. RSA 2559]